MEEKPKVLRKYDRRTLLGFHIICFLSICYSSCKAHYFMTLFKITFLTIFLVMLMVLEELMHPLAEDMEHSDPVLKGMVMPLEDWGCCAHCW